MSLGTRVVLFSSWLEEHIQRYTFLNSCFLLFFWIFVCFFFNSFLESVNRTALNLPSIIYFVVYVLTETEKMCLAWCLTHYPVSSAGSTSEGDDSDRLKPQKPLNSSFTTLIFPFTFPLHNAFFCMMLCYISATLWKKKKKEKQD